MLQVALYKLIFKELEENDLEFQQLREDVSLASILCNLSIENINIHQLQTNDKFQKLMIIIENKLSELENRNKTAKLWINYVRMVSILKEFICAKRMGDWSLHLNTVKVMIPFFHAAGHFPYAKSAQLYLQDMSKYNGPDRTSAVFF